MLVRDSQGGQHEGEQEVAPGVVTTALSACEAECQLVVQEVTQMLVEQCYSALARHTLHIHLNFASHVSEIFAEMWKQVRYVVGIVYFPTNSIEITAWLQAAEVSRIPPQTSAVSGALHAASYERTLEDLAPKVAQFLLLSPAY